MNDVIVTRSFLGICHMQVCALKTVSEDEVLRQCNIQNPAGTTNGWCEIEKEGIKAPVVCDEYPDRIHYMVVC